MKDGAAVNRQNGTLTLYRVGVFLWDFLVGEFGLLGGYGGKMSPDKAHGGSKGFWDIG